MTDEMGSSSISLKELDQKCASRAVAFVIKHSSKGIVSLCANVATLMQDKDQLSQDNEDLKNQLKNCLVELQVFKMTKGEEGTSNISVESLEKQQNSKHYKYQRKKHHRRKDKSINTPEKSCVCKLSNGAITEYEDHGSSNNVKNAKKGLPKLCNEANDVRRPCLCQVMHTHKAETVSFLASELEVFLKQSSSSSWMLHAGLKTVSFPKVPLVGCKCKYCSTKEHKLVLSAKGKPIIRQGDVVVIRNKMLGKAQYLGHIDGGIRDLIWVGVELDLPLGFCDGTIYDETYFSCKPLHGVFTLLTSITNIVPF